MTGEYNLIEIEWNLKKKMPDVIPLYKKYFPLLDLGAVLLPSSTEINRLAGTISDKDIPVLASAVNGKADFLVTGDKKDFGKMKGKCPFRIVTPAEFLEVIMPEVIRHLEMGK